MCETVFYARQNKALFYLCFNVMILFKSGWMLEVLRHNFVLFELLLWNCVGFWVWIFIIKYLRYEIQFNQMFIDKNDYEHITLLTHLLWLVGLTYIEINSSVVCEVDRYYGFPVVVIRTCISCLLIYSSPIKYSAL